MLQSKHIYTVFLLAALVLGAGHSAAHATEKLIFDQDISLRALKNIQSFMRQEMPEMPETLKIAGADLNEDGIPEFIVRPETCGETTGFCPFFVLADMEENVIKLLKTEAKKLALAGSYSHGVRNIIAFKNPENDFDYELYIWDPGRSRYTIKK